MKTENYKADDRYSFVYKSPSEDEGCLIEMARKAEKLGYFAFRDSSTISLQTPSGEIEKFKILKYNEFDSKRKCSSIVVRNSDGDVFAYVKGSDTTMMRMASEG